MEAAQYMKEYRRNTRWTPSKPPGQAVRPWLPLTGAAVFFALVLVIPTVLVGPEHEWPNPPATDQSSASSEAGRHPVGTQSTASQDIQVTVLLSASGTTETVPLENYVAGVVAAEMPASFETEALKAQAIAARTFIVRRLSVQDRSGSPGADVTDTIQHQVYLSDEILKKDWENAGKAEALAKIRKAVQDTRDIIMVYGGRPITASFFSTSNGYTENSEDVWQARVPYLRSVPSPWDQKIAPGYRKTVRFTRDELIQKLNLPRKAIATLSSNKSLPEMRTLSKTAGHRIEKIRIGDEVYSGVEVRSRLGLRSSEFIWQEDSQGVTITTFGNGHGVGMSQWGANGMAKEGYTTTKILQHYYTGISFAKASKLLTTRLEG